jgi:Ser-tRNA(Ala) deacylase AlaX
VTKKIFWDDPYLTELETTVQKIDGSQIILNETIFYAFSGGQESDSGTIGSYPVLKAEKKGKEIVYTLSSDHCLKIGDTVKIGIDWERRYKLMRLHFAAEIVLELVTKKFPAMLKIGAHIAQNKARIDFQWDHSIALYLKVLQQDAQNIIDAHQEIISTFSDTINEKRYWKISEFGQVPCGGTHVKNTKEIGKILLKRSNPGKGKERIEVFVDDKV